MPRGDIARVTALLEKLLDQAQRHSEPMSNLGPGALIMVVSRKDPFTQIEGSRSHEQSLPHPLRYGYSFY